MMFEAPEMLSICRFCAQSPEKCYRLTKTDSEGKSLYSLINTYLPIKVTSSDGFPQIICSNCYRKLKRVIRFIQECLIVQKEVRRLLQTKGLGNPPDSDVVEPFEAPLDVRPPIDQTTPVDITPDDSASEANGDSRLVESSAPRDSQSTKTRPLVPTNCDDAENTNGFGCYVCAKRFKTPAEAAYHEYDQHFKQYEPRFPCGECNLSFRKRNLLHRHRQIHSPNKKFKCDMCSSSFRRKEALNNHRAVHRVTTKFSCGLCSARFTFKMSYLRHLKTHYPVKSFGCFYCGKAFAQKQNLKDHVRVHTGEKPFNCDQCPSKFRTLSQLKTHLKIHSNQKEYKCDVCGSSFRHLNVLKTHRRSHTGETPFSCRTCSKSFKDPTNLRKHERSHSGEKPYQCEKCGRKFSDQSNRRKHVKKNKCVPEKRAELTKSSEGQFLMDDSELAQIICLTYDSHDVDVNVNSYVVQTNPSNETLSPLQGTSEMMEVLDDNGPVRFEAQDGSVYQLTTFSSGPSLPETFSLPDTGGLPSDASLSDMDCFTRIAESHDVDDTEDIDFISENLLIGSSIV